MREFSFPFRKRDYNTNKSTNFAEKLKMPVYSFPFETCITLYNIYTFTISPGNDENCEKSKNIRKGRGIVVPHPIWISSNRGSFLVGTKDYEEAQEGRERVVAGKKKGNE